MKCYNDMCDGELEVRHHKHIENVGGVDVTDETGFAPTCPKCGEVFLDAVQQQAYELRAAALVLRDARFVNGSVVRYARHTLGLRQMDFATVLECEPETVSRWETGKSKISRRDQLAIAAIIDGVHEGQFTVEQLLDKTPSEPTLRVRVKQASSW